MAAKEKEVNQIKKIASLYVLQYLYRYTDDDHGAATSEILEFLGDRGVYLNSRTIPGIIDTINESFEYVTYGKYADVSSKNGIFIEKSEKGRKNFYKLINRPLEYTEVEMAALALNTMKSYNQKDADNIKNKLYSLLSKHENEKIKKSLSGKKEKDKNKSNISWCFEVIDEAVNENKKVRFKYLSSKNVPTLCTVSPYKFHTNQDGVYLFGQCDEYREKHDAKLTCFRVDRIQTIELTDEKAVPCENPQEIDNQINYGRDMAFGETGTAVLVFSDNITGVITDRYGKNNLNIMTLPDGRKRCTVEEKFSNPFLGWVFSLGENLEVKGDEKLLRLMRERLNLWDKKLNKQTDTKEE